MTEESDLHCSDRAPVLQTGRGTTRMSPKLRNSADGETRTLTGGDAPGQVLGLLRLPLRHVGEKE